MYGNAMPRYGGPPMPTRPPRPGEQAPGGMPYMYGMPQHRYTGAYGDPNARGARPLGAPMPGMGHMGGEPSALGHAPMPPNAQGPPPRGAPPPDGGAGGALTPTVYLATYSSVPVFEITVRGIALMRRRSDGYLNATQILKIAGVEKARRTRILEKEILTGEHDKVQGGYGTFQGTWIPLKRAQELASNYSVYHLVRPLLEFDPANGRAVSSSYPKRKASGVESEAARMPAAPPGQQPRFLSLRPPRANGREDAPGIAPGGLMQPLPPDAFGASPAAPAGVPPGSKPVQKEALGAYSAHGYTPQGVPLPSTAETGTKHGLAEPAPSSDKRPRLEGTPPMDEPSLGPSPVRDLNALGPAGGSHRAATRPERRVVVDAGKSEHAEGMGIARFADKAQTPNVADERERRMREVLTGLFVEDGARGDGADPRAELQRLLEELDEIEPRGGRVDLVIDDHGHTALHWASALCRLSLVRMLTSLPPTERGANIFVGNYAGETALHRSVLVTNSFEMSQFAELLDLLDGSLHTRDHRKRTVLHHIALVAGLKGRAAPARYYLGCVLDKLAQIRANDAASALINAQDDENETALNIAARLGNTNMIKMLLDAGARKDLPNYLGITPIDWGITGISGADDAPADGEKRDATVMNELASLKPADVVKSLTKPPQGPIQKSQDVREKLVHTLDELQGIFDRESAAKQQAIETTQTHLQAATRELAARRKHVANAQMAVAQREEAHQRCENLLRALRALRGEDMVDVRADVPAPAPVCGALLQEVDAAADGSDSDRVAALVHARWAVTRLDARCAELQRALTSLDDESQERERKCRRVVAMCAHVPVEKVDRMLDELLAAIESIGQDVDVRTVASFMQKVGRAPLDISDARDASPLPQTP